MKSLRAAAVLLLPVIVACGGAPPETPEARREARDLPVIVISIDTLRSDRVGAYGYPEATTPAIDALRGDAILFASAWSPFPLTLPSHASAFSGAYPYAHGVRDNLGYVVPDELTWLPALLSANGYETGAAVSSHVLRGDTGMARGFGTYDDVMTYTAHETINAWQRPGDVTRGALEAWLSGTRSKRIFAFLHLYEPHSPYTPPEPFASRFDDPYDGEVAAADSVVGAFLADLRARGLYDDALIILLSDHGEGLGDHGEEGHGVFVYREAIQVPLIVKLPDNARAGETFSAPVSLVDVLPTVLGVLGVEPPRGIDGLDLSGLTEATVVDRRVYSESYYPRIQFGWSELVSLVDGRFHYIDAPRVELYDLEQDPAETVNLAESNRRLVAERRDEVRDVKTRHPFRAPAPTDPEEVARLASLGYLGGGTGMAGENLADPKDQLDLLAMLERGARALQAGDLDAAIAAGEEIVARNPEALHGWGLLASAWQSKGRLDRALAALKEQLGRAPSNAHTALWIASIQLGRGELDDAAAHAGLALGSSPRAAHEILAQVALARGDLATAEREASTVLASPPDSVQALLVLSEVRERQERHPDQLALLDRAALAIDAARRGPVRDLQFRRAQALLRLGRVVEAEAALRLETETFPANEPAWANLALVVAGQGRAAEASRILESAVEANPTPGMRRLATEARAIFEVGASR